MTAMPTTAVGPSPTLQVIVARSRNSWMDSGLRARGGYPKVCSFGLAKAKIDNRRSWSSLVLVSTVCWGLVCRPRLLG